MTTEKKSEKSPRKKAPSRGGARKGAGRPRGSTTKVTLDDLMQNIELAAGKTYGELLAHNYVAAISRSDWNGVRDYDKAFMNKLISDKVAVDVTNSEDVVAAKQAAFAAALEKLNQIAKESK